MRKRSVVTMVIVFVLIALFAVYSTATEVSSNKQADGTETESSQTISSDHSVEEHVRTLATEIIQTQEDHNVFVKSLMSRKHPWKIDDYIFALNEVSKAQEARRLDRSAVNN